MQTAVEVKTQVMYGLGNTWWSWQVQPHRESLVAYSEKSQMNLKNVLKNIKGDNSCIKT